MFRRGCKRRFFIITDCCGKRLKGAELAIPIKMKEWDLQPYVLNRLGFKQHTCVRCGDRAYDVRTPMDGVWRKRSDQEIGLLSRPRRFYVL